MFDFDQRVAIVTGAGQGMGRAHAMMLASRNARLIVNDVSAQHAVAVVKEIVDAGGTAVADTHDVAHSAAQVVGTAIEAYGRVDVVVANAGIIRVGLFDQQPEDEFWRVFDVSFRGTVDLARAAWQYLIQSGSGRLILISSSGILANPGASAYGAAKGALWALGNTLAMEGDRVGVQVTTLMPTAWTPMTQGYSDPNITSTLRDTMSPEKVAAFVCFLSHQHTTVHGDFFQIGGNHAGRVVLAGLPRIFLDDATPEAWAKKAEKLSADSETLEQYRATGDQFAAEMIASDPSVAESFENMNPADLGV